jgi:S1-C subfamily serine protease
MSKSSGSKIPKGAVVKIFTQIKEINTQEPWNSTRTSGTGTGFIIKHDGKILVITNHHVIDNYSSIRVRLNETIQKYKASVITVNPVDDIAILSFNDDNFDENIITGIVYMESNLQPILETEKYSVSVVGYPGGDQLSTTEGIVSRLCVQHRFRTGNREIRNYPDNIYDWDNRTSKIQISAAVNPGNSGGPVFNDEGICIGIASSHATNAQNISYIIPCILLNLMLKYLKNKTNSELISYYRKPCPGFNIQGTEDDKLRKFYQIPEVFEGNNNRLGVLVKSVDEFGMSANVLKPGDIIIKIDDHFIGQDGTMKYYNQRIDWKFIFITKTIGIEMDFIIIREGNIIKKTITTTAANYKIPGIERVMEPDWEKKWVIIGGISFLRATTPLLSYRYSSKYGNNWGFSRFDESSDEELIIVGGKFDHPVNEEYSIGKKLKYLEKFNGVRIKNLRELNTIFHTAVDNEVKFLTLEFSNGYSVIMDTKEAWDSFSKISKDYNIPTQSSL